uniref:DNA-binding protein inhibitor ID-4 n=1 Tax=Eptatretus burgeri TaxID=7764 RepID=A0A8C4R3D4_EPTBU
MKARIPAQCANMTSTDDLRCTLANNSMGQVRPGKDEATAALLDNMRSCYTRLRSLVPSIPPHKKLSQVEILQHVIDYILDLQTALESHPPPLLTVEHHLSNGRTPGRPPLSPLNTDMGCLSTQVCVPIESEEPPPTPSQATDPKSFTQFQRVHHSLCFHKQPWITVDWRDSNRDSNTPDENHSTTGVALPPHRFLVHRPHCLPSAHIVL